MTVALNFTTPAQALNAMVGAGAVFTVHRRNDGLGMSFTYKVANGGDLDRCRAILAHVKGKPPQFFVAFRAAIQDIVVEDVETSPTRSVSKGGVSAPPTGTDAEGVVPFTPSDAGRGAA